MHRSSSTRVDAGSTSFDHVISLYDATPVVQPNRVSPSASGTLDTRAVLKAVISAAFDLTHAQTDRVFPGSSAVRGAYELMG